MSDDTNLPERVGFRDIYRAVGESESRIIQSMQNMLSPLNSTLIDHEARLRLAEGTVAPLAREAVKTEERLAAHTSALRLLNDKEVGLFAVLGTGRAVLIGIGVIVSLLAGAVNLITLITHP